MRKRTLWRISPSEFEESYIRAAAKREGRELAGMLHRLVFEAITAREAANKQTSKLVSILRGDATESAQ